jgi:hypothetical protein
MARPVCKGFVEVGKLISLLQRIRPWRFLSRPRWRYARSGPHKTLGVERRFLNQASGTPFDCQALSSSPSRKPSSVEQRPRTLIDQTLRCHRHSSGGKTLSAPQHRPGDPGQLVGEGDDRDVAMGSAHEALRPSAKRRVALSHIGQRRARAPWISCLRRYLLPRLLIPSSFGFPPVVNCRGTRPSHAARSRPRSKLSARPTAATRADATIAPMPGIVVSRRASSTPRTESPSENKLNRRNHL